MNEKRIQQVLEIEKQAQQILSSALREAEQLPIRAEQAAQQIREKTRAAAEEDARQMVENAHKVDESGRIMSEVEQKKAAFEKLAKANMDRAVAYVLEQVIGKG